VLLDGHPCTVAELASPRVQDVVSERSKRHCYNGNGSDSLTRWTCAKGDATDGEVGHESQAVNESLAGRGQESGSGSPGRAFKPEFPEVTQFRRLMLERSGP
jgi:hypothetical protein